MSCHCSRTSGTTFFAASVGVEARRSAAKSMSVQSSSCPIAETIGLRHAAVARTTFSSEKPMRSSKLPPPRATMMTSTLGSSSSLRIAWTTSGGHCAPWTCTCSITKSTAGQRRFTLVMTSPSARAWGAQIRPMQRGNSGSGILFSVSNRPSPLSFLRSSSICALRSPAPTRRMSSAMKLRRVAFTHTSGLPWTTTRSPCLNWRAIATKFLNPMTDIEMSWVLSRSVM